jgi:LPXTG-motif cell wall-anchored protein
MWFDSLGPFNWHSCCVQHDFDYGHQIGKAIADAHLEACVNAALPGMGTLMWAGVALLGGIWYAAAKRKRS